MNATARRSGIWPRAIARAPAAPAVSLLAAALLAMVAAGDARGGSAETAIEPVETMVYSRLQVASDIAQRTSVPAWAMLADGSTVVASFVADYPLDAMVLRKFSADGAVAARLRILPTSSAASLERFAQLEAGELPGWTLSLHGTVDCTIRALDETLAVRWSSDVPGMVEGTQNRCLRLLPLAGGGAVVLRESSMSRFDTGDGSLEWTVSVRQGTPWNAPTLAIQHADSTIWVAVAEIPSGAQAQATLRRYSITGQLLSTHSMPCPGCRSSRFTALALARDGSVFASAATGTAQPGLLMRYAANGAMTTQLPLPIDQYAVQLDPGSDGSLYARMDLFGNTNAVRIDPDTGSILWSRNGSGQIALTEGVLIVESDPFPNGVQVATAIRPDGSVRWTNTVPVGGTAAWLDQLRMTPAGPMALVQRYGGPRSSDCGTSPLLRGFGEDGSLHTAIEDCLMPGNMLVQDIQRSATGHMAVVLRNALLEFDPQGRRQWRHASCEFCTGIEPGSVSIGPAAVETDGSGWYVANYRIGSTNQRATLRRLDSSGNIAFETAFLSPPESPSVKPALSVLFASNNRVVAPYISAPYPGSFPAALLLTVDASALVGWSGAIAPNAQGHRFALVGKLDGDDIQLALVNAWEFGGVPPGGYPHETNVLRVGPNAQPLWLTRIPAVANDVAHDADGSIHFLFHSGDQAAVQSIDANGAVTRARTVNRRIPYAPEIEIGSAIDGQRPLVAGRLLLLLDARMQVIEEYLLPEQATGWRIAVTTPTSWVFDAPNESAPAVLLDRRSRTTLQHLLGSPSGQRNGNRHWSFGATADILLSAASERAPDGTYDAVVRTYDLNRASVLFADSFE